MGLPRGHHLFLGLRHVTSYNGLLIPTPHQLLHCPSDVPCPHREGELPIGCAIALPCKSPDLPKVAQSLKLWPRLFLRGRLQTVPRSTQRDKDAPVASSQSPHDLGARRGVLFLPVPIEADEVRPRLQPQECLHKVFCGAYDQALFDRAQRSGIRSGGAPRSVGLERQR